MACRASCRSTCVGCGLSRLVAGLQARGYSEADIRKILGGNLLRVWGEIEALADKH